MKFLFEGGSGKQVAFVQNTTCMRERNFEKISMRINGKARQGLQDQARARGVCPSVLDVPSKLSINVNVNVNHPLLPYLRYRPHQNCYEISLRGSTTRGGVSEG